MDGQLRDGVAVINVQNGGKLLRSLHAQPGLDRDRPLGVGNTASRKASSLWSRSIPEPLPLAVTVPEGQPEVQVHLGIAQRPQLPDHPRGKFAVLCQQLRDDRRSRVCRRGKLSHLLFNEHPVLRRGDKRRIIAVGSALCAEPFLVGLPPDPVCQALHGGSIFVCRFMTQRQKMCALRGKVPAFDGPEAGILYTPRKNARNPVKSAACNGRSELFERWGGGVCKQRGGQVAVAGIGQQTTMFLPAFSGRFASCRAAQTAAPEEMPTSTPSLWPISGRWQRHRRSPRR